MSKKYCIYLTIYMGNKLPKWYFGSGNIDNIKNNKYHGSVSSKKYKKIWNYELKNNPHLFKTRILRTFYKRKMATICELYIQRKFSIPKLDKYVNLGYASRNFGSGLSYNLGSKRTEDQKYKMKFRPIYIRDNAHKELMSKSSKAKRASTFWNSGFGKYEIIDPLGNKYIVTNGLKLFASTHGLSYYGLKCLVQRNKVSIKGSTKGWKGKSLST